MLTIKDYCNSLKADLERGVIDVIRYNQLLMNFLNYHLDYGTISKYQFNAYIKQYYKSAIASAVGGN